MGRPVKLSDQTKKWFIRHYHIQKRLVRTRELRQRFLIVCEGEKTEPNYFEAFKQELPKDVVQVDIQGVGDNTLSLVHRAKELRDQRANGDYKFDQVWIVFDRDSFPPDDFDNAIHMADSDKMKCAWSNEAFELWYILHFEYLNTGMSRKEYQVKLSRLLKIPYKKNASDMYNTLAEIGNQEQAISWAKRLRESDQRPPSSANPCTTVFLLVEELNRFKTR